VTVDEWFDKANRLRFLQANKFKIEETCTSIREASAWRKKCFPLLPTPDINARLVRLGLPRMTG
jgi:hypothetical protein